MKPTVTVNQKELLAVLSKKKRLKKIKLDSTLPPNVRPLLSSMHQSLLNPCNPVLPFPTRNGFFFFNPPVVEHLKASLERLGLDSVPLYQLHSSISLNSHEKIAIGLAQCIKLGLAKAIGVSNFSKDEL